MRATFRADAGVPLERAAMREPRGKRRSDEEPRRVVRHPVIEERPRDFGECPHATLTTAKARQVLREQGGVLRQPTAASLNEFVIAIRARQVGIFGGRSGNVPRLPDSPARDNRR